MMYDALSNWAIDTVDRDIISVFVSASVFFLEFFQISYHSVSHDDGIISPDTLPFPRVHSRDLKVRFALIKDGCFEMMFLYQMRRCLWQRNINKKSIVRGGRPDEFDVV